MKPHIRIVFRQPVDAGERLPDWVSAIREGIRAPSRLHPETDRIFNLYRRRFFATREFSPRATEWQPDEISAGLNRIYRVVLQDNRSIPAEMIRAIELVPDVVSATPMQVTKIPVTRPKNSSFASSLSARTDQLSRDAIYLPQAHRYSEGRRDITVAVLDTGINLSHPELKHAFRPGYDFVNIIDGAEDFIGDFLGVDRDPEDDVGHGSHVAGIIAAQGLRMPKGVVPRCRLLPVRVLAAMKQRGDPVGAGLIENIDSGIKWAVDQGADVINMSLGVQHSGGGLPHQAVIDYAKRKGVTVVAASGNDGQEHLYYPGAYPHVIAVGAAGPQQQVSAFSTYGDHISLVAPGENIYSTHVNESYRFLTGTSHAAPFVSGAVALLKSVARDQEYEITDAQIKYLLKHSSDRLGRRFKDPKSGYGQLNLQDAIRLLRHKLQTRQRTYSAVTAFSRKQTDSTQTIQSEPVIPALAPLHNARRIESTQGNSYVNKHCLEQ